MSIPTQQKALFIQEARGEWLVASTDVPKPSPGQVLVRLEASSLNPVDWKIYDWDFFITSYPSIIGQDAAGVVVQTGEEVNRVKVGDKVTFLGKCGSPSATFQQYAAIGAELVAKIPDSNWTFEQAASIPLAAVTAATGLYATRKSTLGAELTAPWKEGGRAKYAKQPILIIGGSSSVGQVAIQLAKISGFSPIISTNSPSNNDLVTSIGATHTIDRNLPLTDVITAVRSIAFGPIEIVYDAIGDADTQIVGYEVLPRGGTLISVWQDKTANKFEGEGKEFMMPIGVIDGPPNREFGVELYAHLDVLLERGDIKPNRVEYIPGGLTNVPEALDRLRKDQVSGRKLIVRPLETA